MKLNFHPTRAAVLVGAALLSATFAFPVMAAGGASGPKVAYMAQGNIGEVMVNPYRIAPLTAVIRSGGYVVKNASVRIVPKQNGQEIRYSVSDENVRTAGGIPVFGLYPDWLNTVEVEYDRVFNGKTEHFSDRYQLYAAPVFLRSNGTPGQTHTTFNVKVLKMDPAFKDRLYFINNLIPTPPDASRVVWNNPMGGALEWAFGPENAIVDSTGTVRWYLNPDVEMYDPDQPYKAGIMMGFEQTADGGLLFGYGQRYAKYDMTGREIFNRRLPMGYADYSHGLDAAQNGHIFLRVSAADHRRLDGKRVHTVRDVIAEVDQDGRVVDEFRLFEILDPYRDNVIKALDQGAVCLNIDASQAGKTLSADELAAMDKNDRFGDIAGVGAGRNWAHVNSVDYDPTDDSIIISSRHQSAVIKIGRDKKVKWILSSPEGWREGWADKVLTPVDKDGKPIKEYIVIGEKPIIVLPPDDEVPDPDDPENEQFAGWVTPGGDDVTPGHTPTPDEENVIVVRPSYSSDQARMVYLANGGTILDRYGKEVADKYSFDVMSGASIMKKMDDHYITAKKKGNSLLAGSCLRLTNWMLTVI